MKFHSTVVLCVVLTVVATNGLRTDKTPDSNKSKEPVVTSNKILSAQNKSDARSKSINVHDAEDPNAKMETLIVDSLKFLAGDRSNGIITLTKTAILTKLVTILQIIFYATGSAFFVCSIVDCKGLIGGEKGGLGGSHGGGGYGSGGLFSRSDYDAYVQKQGRPILQAIKNGQKMYQYQQ